MGSILTTATIKETRLNAGLSASEAAALVGVKTVTWQRWEGQTSRATEIPYAHWDHTLGEEIENERPTFTDSRNHRVAGFMP